jgi:hypothetical protein
MLVDTMKKVIVVMEDKIKCRHETLNASLTHSRYMEYM